MVSNIDQTCHQDVSQYCSLSFHQTCHEDFFQHSRWTCNPINICYFCFKEKYGTWSQLYSMYNLLIYRLEIHFIDKLCSLMHYTNISTWHFNARCILSIQANNIEGFSNFNLMTKSNEMIPLDYAFDFFILSHISRNFLLGVPNKNQYYTAKTLKSNNNIREHTCRL